MVANCLVMMNTHLNRTPISGVVDVDAMDPVLEVALHISKTDSQMSLTEYVNVK